MTLKSPVLIVCSFGLLFSACARPTVSIPTAAQETRLEGYDAVKHRISADPVAFLRESLARATEVKEFRAVFLRQERLGMLKELSKQETILAEYRDKPFSVRFTWQEEDSEYAQCVYVSGKNEDKVVLMPRKGLLGLPPAVQKIPPKMAVDWKKARNPITDFGPRRMLERVLDGIEQSKKFGGVKFALGEPAQIGPASEPCHHLELRYPKGKGITVALQDIYISTTTNLPVGTYLWHDGKEGRSNTTLDAMYLYTQLDQSAQLTDANFEICTPKGRAASEKTALTDDSAAD